jgi:hypothetical protein
MPSWAKASGKSKKKAAVPQEPIPDRDMIFIDPHLDFEHATAELHLTPDSNCLVSERYTAPPGDKRLNVVASATLRCDIADVLAAYLDVRSESPKKKRALFVSVYSLILPSLLSLPNPIPPRR